jgi:DNA-binding CsgD family transcriptional regulator/septal ring factor EnvC (AmiA/AmiB activator)
MQTFMNKILLTILLALAMPLCSQAHSSDLNTLLEQLDETIEHSNLYVAKRTHQITLLQHKLKLTRDLAKRYEVNFELFKAYKPFINDSAISYLNRCIQLAKQLKEPSKEVLCKSLLALRCSNTGMYNESLYILKDVNPAGTDNRAKGTYYFALAHVYGEITYYTHIQEVKEQYGHKASQYQQLMYQVMPHDDNDYMQSRELDALNAHQYKTSMQINDKWLKLVKKGSYPYALVTLYRYLEYKAQNDTANMMRWLVESVITDVRNGVMDQGSMWEMANQLLVQGDVDRAYKYISFTSDCASKFGSRQRLSQISPLLASIADKYKAERETYYQHLRFAISVISIMALLLLIFLFYVNRQRTNLSEARDNLAKSYSRLSVLNKKMSSVNDQLQDSNAALSGLNQQLKDANRVKEEYVGRFMRLCSVYIDKLDQLRKIVNKRVKNRQYAELYDMTRPQEFKEAELTELYAYFDSAFLHLFPNFLEEFNALLKPEEKIEMPENGQLNTSIRIFALIRLGIDDSSKIAEFLHYSVNTIYNYRARMKNGALNRDEFEQRVKKIGLQ